MDRMTDRCKNITTSFAGGNYINVPVLQLTHYAMYANDQLIMALPISIAIPGRSIMYICYLLLKNHNMAGTFVMCYKVRDRALLIYEKFSFEGNVSSFVCLFTGGVGPMYRSY